MMRVTAVYGAILAGLTLAYIAWYWWDARRSLAPRRREPDGYLLIECELGEPLGDVPALPDDFQVHARARMDRIEAVGERDGWRCGICHAPAEHLYYVDLHDDDGTLCCAVCSQILDTGALE